MKYSDILPLYLEDPCEPLFNQYKLTKGGKYKKATRYDKFNEKIVSGDNSVTSDHSIKTGIHAISETTQESVSVKSLREKIFASRIDIEEDKDNYFIDEMPGMIFKEDS